MVKFITYLILGLIVMSCAPKDPMPPMDDDDMPMTECPNFESDIINIIWHSLLNQDSILSLSIRPQLLEDKVLFSDRFSDNSENVLAFNTSDGSLLWSTEDFASNDQSIVSHAAIVSQGNLFVSTRSNVYKYNGETGGIVYTENVEYGGPRIGVIGNDLYFSRATKNGLATVQDDLIRRNDSSIDWEVVFEIPTVDNFEAFIEPPSLFMNSVGDSILIFQNRSWNFVDNFGKVDLIAFNLTTKTLQWKFEDVTEDGSSSIFPPNIKGDKIYLHGAGSIHCLEAETGEELWFQHITGEGFFQGPSLFVDSKWILNGDSRSIYAFDMESGKLLWQNDDTGSTVPNMAYFQDHIYFCSLGTGKLYKIRADDGSKVYELLPPNGLCTTNALFSGGVAIDQEKGFLFTHDQFFVMCIDLN